MKPITTYKFTSPQSTTKHHKRISERSVISRLTFDLSNAADNTNPPIYKSDKVIETAPAATCPGTAFPVASRTAASSRRAMRISYAVFTDGTIFRNARFRSAESPGTNEDVTLSRVAVTVGVAVGLENCERLAFLVVIDVAV